MYNKNKQTYQLKQTASNCCDSGGSLDKLGQVGTSPLKTSENELSIEFDQGTKASDSKTLTKRARSNFFSNVIKSNLCKIGDSPLHESYKKSCSCNSNIEVSNGKARATYCKQRWCLVCSRINTGQAINKYLPILKASLENPYFVTLSRPNVTESNLSSEIDILRKTFTKIARTLKKRHQRGELPIKFSAVYRLECTYNAEMNTYHPHLHCIIDGKEVAELVESEWLSRFPTANEKGQKVKEADDGSMKELLKYTVKLLSDVVNEKNEKKQEIHIKALDTMFKAMKGKRLMVSYGNLYGVKLDEELSDDEMNEAESEQLSIEFEESKRVPSDGAYQWHEYDWWNMETGESLCGYEPTEKDLEFSKRVVLPAIVGERASSDEKKQAEGCRLNREMYHYQSKGTGGLSIYLDNRPEIVVAAERPKLWKQKALFS